jgi:hypothetical protein
MASENEPKNVISQERDECVFRRLLSTRLTLNRSPVSGEKQVYEKTAHSENGYGPERVNMNQNLSAK